jgi:hypothetical protein
LQECPALAQKLEGIRYLYEKFGGDGRRVQNFLFFQQKKVKKRLFR